MPIVTRWWRDDTEPLSSLLAVCEGNSLMAARNSMGSYRCKDQNNMIFLLVEIWFVIPFNGISRTPTTIQAVLSLE